MLDPAATEYGKTVLYVTHDVTSMLAKGRNAIAVMLGNGWFSEPAVERYGDSPRLLLQLQVEYANGDRTTIVSDDSWRTGEGAIRQDDFWHGEYYDARLETPGWDKPGYDDARWPRALLKAAPGGVMASQLMEPMRVMEVLPPQRLTCPVPGVCVYDFGKLFGGWVRLKARGAAGTHVTIRYCARLDPATGLLDRSQHPGADLNTDHYILRGDGAGEVWQPRFTYHSVQYVQVEGLPGPADLHALEGCMVHSAVDLTGDFESSSPLLNRIHQNVVQTFRNGLFGLPLDCLYREHWAWTDPATITGTLYVRKHMPQFWRKWLRDIADSQGPDGLVPTLCPVYQGPYFDAAWGGNYPILVWYLHQYLGDRRLLEEHYDSMKRCVDYLTSIAVGHCITRGSFGDHMLPGAAPGQEEFINLGKLESAGRLRGRREHDHVGDDRQVPPGRDRRHQKPGLLRADVHARRAGPRADRPVRPRRRALRPGLGAHRPRGGQGGVVAKRPNPSVQRGHPRQHAGGSESADPGPGRRDDHRRRADDLERRAVSPRPRRRHERPPQRHRHHLRPGPGSVPVHAH